MSAGKVLLGLLAGATTGVLLGVLFAPEKGSKTRKKLLSKKDDYVDELNKKFDDFVDSASKKYEAVKEDVTGFKINDKAKSEKA